MSKVTTLLGHKITNPELFRATRINGNKHAQIAELANDSTIILGTDFKIVVKNNKGKTYTHNKEEITRVSWKETPTGIKNIMTEEYIAFPKVYVKMVENSKKIISKIFPKKFFIRQILESTNIPRGKWILKSTK